MFSFLFERSYYCLLFTRMLSFYHPLYLSVVKDLFLKYILIRIKWVMLRIDLILFLRPAPKHVYDKMAKHIKPYSFIRVKLSLPYTTFSLWNCGVESMFTRYGKQFWLRYLKTECFWQNGNIALSVHYTSE